MDNGTPHVSAYCCFCGQPFDFKDAFGLTLFPADDNEIWQQWWAHPMCVRTVMHADMLKYSRPEIAEKLGIEGYEFETEEET